MDIVDVARAFDIFSRDKIILPVQNKIYSWFGFNKHQSIRFLCWLNTILICLTGDYPLSISLGIVQVGMYTGSVRLEKFADINQAKFLMMRDGYLFLTIRIVTICLAILYLFISILTEETSDLLEATYWILTSVQTYLFCLEEKPPKRRFRKWLEKVVSKSKGKDPVLVG